MGIQGLLPLLKSIHKPTHLRHFSGQTLGVDAYGWLHRGTVSCAIELAEGKPTRKHIDFALHRVRMLIHFGVKPYIVFDGDYLPSKSHTEKERAARRKESKRLGLEFLRMGRPSQAQLELQKAVDVTPTMARELIEELKRLDVPYIVAPYEADSQLAYLEKQGIIQGVVSEDSDLLVFGVKCLLTKLDQYGECVMINRADFTACKDISLVGWSDKEFRMMAMLSGCDYLPGIDKMGLKTAYRLIRKHKTFERVVRTVQFDGKMKVPAGYVEAFERAERTFMYQWVFCPEARKLLNLTVLPTGLEASSMPYIGKDVEPELAAGVASGELDPNTKQPIILPNRFAHRARRYEAVRTPDEKQGKPITEFFRKRTPLAELDPNSFTPSDHQQRLLDTHRNTSWSASQVAPARVSSRTRNSSIPIPSSAPQVSRRTATDPFPSARRMSPKRQRLCSESSIAAAMQQSTESSTSHFFAKPAPLQSPSLRRKARKNESEEFELWSDDSVAEAVAAATAEPIATPSASVSSPRKRKKLEVHADRPKMEDDSSVGDISQDSITTTATEASLEPASAMTPDTSFESVDSPQEYSTINRGIRANLAALRYRNSPLSQPSALRTKSTPLFASTPLQFARHEEALNIETSPRTPSAPRDNIEVPNSSPFADSGEAQVTTTDDPEDDPIGEKEQVASEQQEVVEGHSVMLKGSEDQLVPESPEGEDSGGAIRKLDLGKFVFASAP